MMSLMSWYDNLPEGSIAHAAKTVTDGASKLGKFVVDLHTGSAFTGDETLSRAESKTDIVARDPITSSSKTIVDAMAIDIDSEDEGPTTKEAYSVIPLTKAATETVAKGARHLAEQAYYAGKLFVDLHKGTAFTGDEPARDLGPKVAESLTLSEDGKSMVVEGLEASKGAIQFGLSVDQKVDVTIDVHDSDFDGAWASITEPFDKRDEISKDDGSRTIYSKREVLGKHTDYFIEKFTADGSHTIVNCMRADSADIKVGSRVFRGLEKVTIKGAGRHASADSVLMRILKVTRGFYKVAEVGLGYRVDVYPHKYDADFRRMADFSKPPIASIDIEAVPN